MNERKSPWDQSKILRNTVILLPGKGGNIGFPRKAL